MKRTIIICIILLTLCLAGVLYGKHHQPEEREPATLEEAYKAQYPEQIPDVIMGPVPNNILF